MAILMCGRKLKLQKFGAPVDSRIAAGSLTSLPSLASCLKACIPSGGTSEAPRDLVEMPVEVQLLP